jgi:hypothetical protein
VVAFRPLLVTLFYIALGICLVAGLRITARAFGVDGTPRLNERALGLSLLGVSLSMVIVGSIAGF